VKCAMVAAVQVQAGDPCDEPENARGRQIHEPEIQQNQNPDPGSKVKIRGRGKCNQVCNKQ